MGVGLIGFRSWYLIYVKTADKTFVDRLSLLSMTLTVEIRVRIFGRARANDRRSECDVTQGPVGRRREFGTFHIIVCSPIVDKVAAMHDLSAFSIVQVRSAAFSAQAKLVSVAVRSRLESE
jgi:hypothetical protein